MFWDAGAAQASAAGESISGDAYLILPLEHRLVVCLADGLGHGRAAREAAEVFLSFVLLNPNLGLAELLEAGGAALRGTRGAAATVLNVQPARVEAAGVGNVSVWAKTRVPFQPLIVAGVLGAGHNALRTYAASAAPGDVFVLHTDGIARLRLPAHTATTPAREMAADILEASGRNRDDATVVVVRVLGLPA
jgi:serine/threonine protein phosphatase PrpC